MTRHASDLIGDDLGLTGAHVGREHGLCDCCTMPTGKEAMTRHAITLTVNGSSYTREVDARKLLSDFIRDDLGLTGTHVGCEHGLCGCCTIFLNGVTVKSCLTLAVQADGAELKTIEGLAPDGKFHPIQEAFWENHGLQCGFCTPGMLMSAVHLLEKNPNPTEQEIRKAIGGNLCRCTGYVNIVKSIKSAAEKMAGKLELTNFSSSSDLPSS